MKQQRHRALAASCAGLVSVLGLASASQAIVLGDFETGLDNWEAVDATSMVPVESIGNTAGLFSLKVETPPSFRPTMIRHFAGTEPQIVADRAALMAATTFSIDVTTRPEDFTLVNPTPIPPQTFVESWIKFENVVINGPGIGYNQLPINERNDWNMFQGDGTIAEPGETGSDPAGPTTRHFTVNLGSINWSNLTVDPETGSPEYLQMIIITQSTTNFPGLTYYFDNIQIEQVGSVLTWNFDGNGNWSHGANWNPNTPGGPNDSSSVANFFGVITQPITVTVNAARTVAAINFNNTNTYTIGGAQTLTLQAASGNANISVQTGSHVITAPLVFANDTNFSIEAGATLTIAGSLNATGRNILKQGSGVVISNTLRAGNLQIVSGGVIVPPRATPNDPLGTVVVTGLQISGNLPYLDIGNNSLIVDYSEGSPLNAVRDLILQGYNEGGGWIPLGLTAQIANEPFAEGPFAGQMPKLGFGEASSVGNPATFGGQPVDGTAILVKFTAAGDATLDGQVDVADLGALASNWQANAVWSGGDFDYSGFVDVNDLGLLASNWQLGVGNPLGPGSFAEALAALGLGGVAVPEPTASAAAVALLGLLLRRARSQRSIHE